MRCRACGARWSLVDGLGPGGNASPGQYFSVSLLVLIAALPVGWFGHWLVGVCLAGFSLLLLSMAIGGCGHQKPATAYQGSECPRCGKQNFIWPWNF